MNPSYSDKTTYQLLAEINHERMVAILGLSIDRLVVDVGPQRINEDIMSHIITKQIMEDKHRKLIADHNAMVSLQNAAIPYMVQPEEPGS